MRRSPVRRRSASGSSRSSQSGELVPDELTIGLIRERLAEDDAHAGFVLDGFPRNIAQAKALDDLLAALDRPLSAVLEFELPDEVSVERLLGRAAEEGRADDTPETIARRLEIYHRDTAPLSEHYRATGKLVRPPRGSLDRRGLGRDRARSLSGGAGVIVRKSPAEIAQMGRAGRIVVETLALIGEAIKPGVTTAELDALAEEFIRSQDGSPTFKGYRGYPASICASPNEMVVHGIPGPYTPRRRRHPLGRRRRHARRLRRRLRLHVPGR